MRVRAPDDGVISKRMVQPGQVVMAGQWDVTVTVKRAGKEIGSRKFPIAAQ